MSSLFDSGIAIFTYFFESKVIVFFGAVQDSVTVDGNERAAVEQ